MRIMESITRNVAEIDSADRRAIEHLIGKDLTEHQQVIISVVTLPDEPAIPGSDGVPDWWKVYEGMDDEEVDRLDQAIRQRAEPTRAFG
jgi:hypothetical protein